MSINVKDIVNSVKKQHGVSIPDTAPPSDTEILKKYGYDSVEDITRPNKRSTETVEVIYSDEEVPTGGLPGMSSGDDTGFPIGGMAPVRFEDVNLNGYEHPLASSTAPPLVKEVLAVAVDTSSEDGAFSVWRSGKQGTDISNPRTINLARIHAVIPDRIEAAFRAGFQAAIGIS